MKVSAGSAENENFLRLHKDPFREGFKVSRFQGFNNKICLRDAMFETLKL
jgi:hypothetical protein